MGLFASVIRAITGQGEKPANNRPDAAPEAKSQLNEGERQRIRGVVGRAFRKAFLRRVSRPD